MYCLATVYQPVGLLDFTPGKNEHIHQPKIGAIQRARTVRTVREECEENIFTSARGIVDRVMNVEFEGKKYNSKSTLNKQHDIDISTTIICKVIIS